MGSLGRRGFIGRVGTAIAAYALGGQLSGLLPRPPQLVVPKQFGTIGISIRFIRYFDINEDRHVHRLDVFGPDGHMAVVSLGARCERRGRRDG